MVCFWFVLSFGLFLLLLVHVFVLCFHVLLFLRMVHLVARLGLGFLLCVVLRGLFVVWSCGKLAVRRSVEKG